MATLIGKAAPAIETTAIVNQKIVHNFTLNHFKGKQVVLFFYPLDFTFVCPTELHAFQDKLGEFEARNTQVIGCSVDSAYSHLAWLNTPVAKGGIHGIKYPLIADLNKEFARSFNVLFEEQGIAYRGLFLIDAQGIIRHQVVNDLPLGRSVDEVLRTLDAWLYFQQNGEVCPANWHKGKKAMTPSQEGLENYFTGSIGN
jgi:peroxiredoxin 2/4